jgi:hypothetical protein
MTVFTSPRRLARLASALLVAALALSGCSTSISTPTPPEPTASLINDGRDGLLIPLHVERSDLGNSRLGMPVQVDGKPVYVMVDSGTTGLRVLASILPRPGYPAVGAKSTLSFATGAQVSGPAVKLPVSVLGMKPVELTAQAVDDVRCMPGAKRCIANDGYTGEFGWAFSGIFGIGADWPDDTCCTPPLRALTEGIGQRYLLHAGLARPYLVLSPSDALTRDFTRHPLARAQDGALQWPAGCVQVADKLSFCAPVVLATGSPGMIRIETDKAPNWLADDDENKVLTQGNYNVAVGVGKWVHRFADAQVTIVKTKPGANRIVLGLMALQHIDVLFDFAHGQLGLRAARDSETLGG